jgi:hypothetical protein
MLENHLEARGGEHAMEGNFILHWVRSLIYPNAPYWLVTTAGVTACAISLVVYARRGWVWWDRSSSGG